MLDREPLAVPDPRASRSIPPAPWRPGEALILLLCISTPAGASMPVGHVIEGIPHVRQAPDLCGEACVSMALSIVGRRVSQEDVLARSGVPSDARRGCWTPDLYRALSALGIQTPPPWIALGDDAAGRSRQVHEAWEEIRGHVSRDGPVIVCTHADESLQTTEHFRLIVGYDERQRVVVFHDPAVEHGAYLRMPVARFFKLWPLSDGRGGRFLVRFLMPRRPPLAVREVSPTARQVAAVRATLGPGFLVEREGPFIVAGDLPAGLFESFRAGTVRWAYERLRAQFFHHRVPGRAITVYLFADARSYRRNARRLFGEEPSTPFGYYSAANDALVMNIATGGGTLVHEMVHPLLEADFPGVPAWFNEGLASLFEQSAERGGAIVGLTNWRLAGLKAALRAGTSPALEQLMGTTRSRFYGDGSGLHYAASRYLLYWLQERGLLEEYYRRYREDHRADPRGIEVLRGLLGGRSMASIEREWARFVMGLRFDA